MYDTATRVKMVKNEYAKDSVKWKSTEFLPCLPFVYYYLLPL